MKNEKKFKVILTEYWFVSSILLLLISACENIAKDADKPNSIVLDQSFSGTIDNEGDIVEFTLKPYKDCYAHFILEEGNNTDFKPKISLRTKEDGLVAQNNDYSQAILVNIFLEQDKEYIVQIQDYNGNYTGTYYFSVKEDKDDLRYLWRGNSSDNNGSSSVELGKIDYLKDSDWYWINTGEESFVHIIVEERNSPSDFNPKVRLYINESNQQQNNTSDYKRAVLVNQKLEKNSKYYVLVSGMNDNNLGEYKITYMKDKDDNRDLIDGSSLTGSIDFKDDEDVYYIHVQENGYYHLSLKETSTPSDIDPKISIYNYETGYRMDSKSDYEHAVLVNLELNTDNRYKVTCSNYRNNSDTDNLLYYLNFSKDKDDGKSISHTYTSVEGEMDYVGDIDRIKYYPFSVNDRFEITTLYPHFKPKIKIYNENNQLVKTFSSNDNYLNIENMGLELSKAYLILISDVDTKNCSSYEIKLK